MNITFEQRQALKQQGYSDSEINSAIAEVEKEELTGNKSSTTGSNSRVSSFGSRANEDIVKLQLELNDILERTEHLLRGDIVIVENGKKKWVDNPNPKDNLLNEYGVNLIMKLLSMYVNRDRVLGDYDSKEIAFKVLDFGIRLNNLIFMKYDEMGMDTEDKRKEYSMLVGALTDLVHNVYTRAKDGGERRSLREMINVNQNNQMQMGYSGMPQGQMQPKVRGILNPMRYIAGKYVS